MMMAQFNRLPLLQSLGVYREQLDRLYALLETEDWPNLEAFLRQTQGDRPKFLG
jgi:arogenate dehydrogenase (NADP+)